MNIRCPFTGSSDFEKVFTYNKAPKGEIELNVEDYRREIWQNKLSKHYLSVHRMDISNIYSKEYVDATYIDGAGLFQAFEKIISLPFSKSDNKNRALNINNFFKRYAGRETQGLELLDIGSGLSVFPHEMKKYGWDVTALDPDHRAVEHARKNVGIKAIHSDYLKFEGKEKYDLVSLNKVLEHIVDPLPMLRKCKYNLKDNALLYIEVPDGEMASNDELGKNREEFFIDHIHVFSFLSLAMMVTMAGFTSLLIERLQEPSTKYTLRAFIKA